VAECLRYQLTHSCPIIDTCEIDYHAKNIIAWIVRCFLCKPFSDYVDPAETVVDFFENNYGPEWTHSEFVEATYHAVKELIYTALPGYSQLRQMEQPINIHVSHVNMDTYDRVAVYAPLALGYALLQGV
jgi:hypothetical protein